MIGSILRMRKEGEEFDFQKNTNKAYWQESIMKVDNLIPVVSFQSELTAIDTPTYPIYELLKISEKGLDRENIIIENIRVLDPLDVNTVLSDKTLKYFVSNTSQKEFNSDIIGVYQLRISLNSSEVWRSEPFHKGAAPPAPPIMKFTITGSSFTLPTVSGQTYNCMVNYGDGSPDKSITAWDDANTSHTYAGSGTYQITILGKFGGWSFNNGGDKLKLLSIDEWGLNEIDYLTGGFFGCSNLTSIADGSIDATSSLTILTNCLYNTGISTLDVDIFKNCTSVTNITNLFYSSSLTVAQNGLLDAFTNVVSLASVFGECNNLVTLGDEIFKLLTSLTGVAQIFLGCDSLLNIPADLFRYNINITNFFNAFRLCKFTSIPADLFRYNTAVTSFEGVLSNCYLLTTIQEDLFYYNSSVTNYKNALSGARVLVLPTRIFNTSSLSIVTNFDGFMLATFTVFSATGTIQDVWTYATSATSVNTFLNQTSLTNYATIPNGWKGL